MKLWIVDDDKTHLETIAKSIREHEQIQSYSHVLEILTYDSLESFHKDVDKTLNFKKSPPDLVIADYDFKLEGDWISYIKNFYADGSFPFRYMIMSQAINSEQIINLRKNDPNSLYVKMKGFDKSFQRFLTSSDVYADIIGDLIVSTYNAANIREKYRIPPEFAKGKTNDLFNSIIAKPGQTKLELCELHDMSGDSFNKVRSRINLSLKEHKVFIGSPADNTGYHLIEKF